jgi:phosphoglycerate dehydrogenase-like enzyme
VRPSFPLSSSMLLTSPDRSVVSPEPLPSYSPLWSLENAIITMHWSGATKEYHRRALDVFMKNIRRIDSGEGAYNVYRGKGVRP